MRRLLPLFLLLAPASFGYIRQAAPCPASVNPPDCPAPPVSLVRTDNTGIQFYLNDKVVPGVQSTAAGKGTITVITPESNPQSAIQAAFATWNHVSSANIKFLPLKTTSLAINSGDNQMTIAIASTAAEISAVGGALAVTADAYTFDVYTDGKPCLTDCPDVPGGIADSDIILNPAFSFSTSGTTSADLQAVMTHELGHALSANHSGLLGATMYQLVPPSARYLSADDIAFASAAYPLAAAPISFGTISGTISTSANAGVAYGLITAIDQSDTGATISGVTNPDGTYSLQAPAGSYIVYAEPINGLLPINIYLTSAQLAQATLFQTTFFGTAANPTNVALAANGTATVNITVNSTPSTLSVPHVALGGAGKTGDVTGAIPSINAPLLATYGTSFDLAFAGTGFNQNSTIAIYGPGITVGKVSVDPTPLTGSLAGLTLLRATVTVKALQTRSLASVIFTTGSNTFSASGLLVLVPPAPVMPVAGVTSAAAYGASGNVSPGEYVTFYGTGIGPATGPFYGGYTNTGYESGFLPNDLGGASVTFDGIAAPMFYSGSTQLNLQVPFEVKSPSTKVVVSFFGSTSTTITVPVVAANPAVFTYPDPTSVYAANQDGTINSVANPAARGSYVTVVGTGIGKPAYAIQTGGPAPVAPQSSVNANGYSATIGDKTVAVAYAGWFNGFTAEAEWILQIPSDSATGAVPIVFSNGSASTQPNVTIQIAPKP